MLVVIIAQLLFLLTSLLLFNYSLPRILTPIFGIAGTFYNPLVPLKTAISTVILVSSLACIALPTHVSLSKTARAAVILMTSSVLYATLLMYNHEGIAGDDASRVPQLVYAGTVYPVTFLIVYILLQEIRILFFRTSAMITMGLVQGGLVAALLYSMENLESLVAKGLVESVALTKCQSLLAAPIPLFLYMLTRAHRQRQKFNAVFSIFIYCAISFAAMQMYRFCRFPGTCVSFTRENRLDLGMGRLFRLYAQGESTTGWISVVESSRYQALLLRSDMSILGGRFIETNDSVYRVFNMMEMTRLTVQNSASSSPLRCLQLGLGIGVSADALARLGEIVDIIEIDPLIYEYAVTWFGLQTHADARVFLEDAHDVIPRLAPNQYHVIMHDVFTGGLMEGSLFTKEFLGSLAKLLKPNGVLGMNVVGSVNDPVFISVYRTLAAVFTNIRCFGDEFVNERVRNFVLFASNGTITFRELQQADFLDSHYRKGILEQMPQLEIDLSGLGEEGRVILSSRKEDLIWLRENQLQGALEHWKIMKKLFPSDFWLSFI